MTYKKQKDISGEDIQIDSSNLVEKLECYLTTKYTQEVQNFAVCINSFDWYTQLYICHICSHENCQKIMGFIEGKSEDDLKVYLNQKFAWVLENEDGSQIKAGDYLTSSTIKGLMTISKSQTKFRVGIDCEDQDNVLLQKITGHDRLGLLYDAILNEDGNPTFERLPKVRYFNTDGSPSEEFKYFQSLKKATTIKDIKTKRLDMDAIDKMKHEDDERIKRLTRNTKSVSISRPQHPILARKDSGTSFLLRKNSRDITINTSRTNVSQKKEELEVIKRTVFKAYLLPIF